MNKFTLGIFSIIFIIQYATNQDNWSVLGADQEKIEIKIYYESLCPDCRIFDTGQLVPLVQKLGKHLDIHTNPYGKANTTIYQNGTIEIQCQHGPAECYGNMLHACAIEYLDDANSHVIFNSCMMNKTQEGKGSDDKAADKCGKVLGIDTNPIKQCAKSSKGSQLLKTYGDESKPIGFKHVPHILVNEAVNDGTNFFTDVCNAFKNKPTECT